MSYHDNRIPLAVTAMTDPTSTGPTSNEAGRGGYLLYTFVKLAGTGQRDR
jgi:hypothetical protein